REQLGVHWAVSARLRAHTRSLHELLRRCPPSRGELAGTLVDVARLSALALNVARTSVWLFDDARQVLRCVVELRAATEVEAGGKALPSGSCPAYVQALKTEVALAVVDARTDPRTIELEPYLTQHGVGALLDIPLVVPGDLLGVVCHEHVGGARQWDEDEVDFASSVGSLVALALETERRIRAEHAARGIEAKYRYLVESLPVTVYSFDYRTNRLDYVSPQGIELGEFASIEEVLGKGANAWVERVHVDDRARVMERLALGGVSGGLAQEVSYRICLPSGKTRWIRDTGRVVRAADGRPISVQGILCDVTEQMQAEASRQEFERRYRALLESVDMVGVTLDAAGRATFVNDAFVKVSGYAREELIGYDWFEKVVPSTERDRVRARYLSDIQRSSIVPRFELEIETRAGQRRQLLCANTMLRGSDGAVQGSASLALDITDRRTLDDALLQQTKLESLGRLAAGVAHDFNNLLTVILGQTSLLKEGIGRDDARTYELMEQALDQASQLTGSLLAYGRRQPRRRRLVLADALVEETRSLLAAMTKKHLALSVSLQAPGAQVRIDPVELRQVLINLVSNAADAMQERGGSVRITSHVELLDDREARSRGLLAKGEYVTLSILDDGPGIDPAVMKRLFEPFFTTKGEGRGTGLGLAIAQSVVTRAGGAIAVESAAGKGTQFRVYLPRELPEPRPRTVRPLGPVMVVEGDRRVRDAICEPLQAAGYDVYPAEDIKTAARLLSSSSRVGLLITSPTLEDGSGLALARSLRTLRPQVPVIMVAEPDEIDEVFNGCVAKPVDPARLLPLVEEATRSRGSD
ncbi:MAG: PAS domain S-box protein, partial [Planctomycetota bacterium]